MVDTLTTFSITSANKITSLLQYNIVNSSQVLTSNNLIVPLVRSTSPTSGHLFFSYFKKSSFVKLLTGF